MYREFFGLRCRPFEDRADARFFYATPDREEALAVMEYEARYGERMALVVGEAGTGKTLLIRALLGKLTPTERAVVLTWTTGDDPDLVRETAKAFGLTLPAEDVENREQRALSRIRRGLSRHVKEGRRCILIIDQAENLTPRNLSQLSMLSDLHHQGTRLLNIILVGQPPLRHLLQRDEFATLSQQVYGAKTLAALSTQETIAYIRHRMQVAGSADPDVFDEQAARLIHEASQGLPRIINRICEASLVAAYGASSKTVTCDIVRDVIATCGESMRETAPSSKAQDASLALAPSQQTAAEPTADTVALVDDRELRKIEQAISRAERIAGATDQAVTRSADVEQKLSSLLADAERVIATASESVRLSTQSCEDLEQRLVDLGERAQSQCGTIESQIAAARAESGVLLERVRGLQQVCAQAQEIEDRLQTFARGLASKADLVQERTTALMSAVESGREEQARLTESIAQAHSVKQDVQEAATAVRAMMAEARAESERFKEAFLLEIKQACRDQLEAMFREVEQEKKAAIQRTLADYDAQAKQLLERTKREHEAIRRQHADDVQRHAQWRREWEQEIGRVRQEIDQRIVSLRKTIDETAARHDELRSSVGFVMNDIAEATKRVETLSGRARRCTEEAQAAVAASQDVHGQLEESTSAARELVQQAGTASERLEAVCRRAADTLARIAEASERVAQLRPQAENAQALLTELASREAAGQKTRESLENAAEAARTLAQSLQAATSAAADKIGRLDSHQAAALNVIRRLAEATRDGHGTVERLEQLDESFKNSTGEVRAALERMTRDVWDLATRAEAQIQQLARHSTEAKDLLKTFEETRDPARSVLVSLREQVAQAHEQNELLASRFDEAKGLAERIGGIAQLLNQSKTLEAAIREATENALAVQERLAQMVESADDHLRVLDDREAVFQGMAESFEQMKLEAEGTTDRFLSRIGEIRRTVEQAETLCRTLEEKRRDIEARFEDLQRKADRFERAMVRATERPGEIISAAQEQAAQLQRVCSAVRKVFRGLARASLEAREQSAEFEASSRQARERLARLTAETQRAAQTLHEWVEEALRVQQRLERTVEAAPKIQDTHPARTLRRLTRAVEPVSRLTDAEGPTGLSDRLEVLKEPDAAGTTPEPDEERPPADPGNIAQLIKEAQTAVETVDP